MALNEDIIQKRLRQVRVQQDSVESISAWISHHQKYVTTISRVWFDVYLTANDDLRISLIYVMNDFCQKSRKCPKDQFCKITSSFFHYLRFAIPLSSDKVKEKLRRVIGILKERLIFSPHKIDELNLILEGKLTKEFPLNNSLSEDVGKQTAEESGKLKKEFDKYYGIVQKYLSDEGIYHTFSKKGDEKSAKRLRLSSRDGDDLNDSRNKLENTLKKVSEISSMNDDSTVMNSDNFLNVVAETKNGLERSEQIRSLAQNIHQAAAAEIAKQDGKEGILNRKTLGLEHSTQPKFLKDLPEVSGTSYDSWKHIRTERIQQLKRKVSSEAKNGSSESYSPTKTGHESLTMPVEQSKSNENVVSPAKKSLSFNQSEEANQFLSSIPLPKDMSIPPPSIMSPPPLQISPTRTMPNPISMNYDCLPPGVDFPPPLQIPPHRPYDPSSIYSPTNSNGSYFSNQGMNYSTQSPMISPPPRFYAPSLSPTSPPPHVYNNSYGRQQRPRFPQQPQNNSSAYYDPNFYNR